MHWAFNKPRYNPSILVWHDQNDGSTQCSPENGRVVGHRQELHLGDIINRVVFVPIPNKTGTISQL